MAVIDPKKLLPESSKKTSILVPKSNVQVASPSMSTKMLRPVDKPVDGGGSIVIIEKLIKIDDILKDTLKVKKDREKAEDKQEEKEKRQKKEENLEKQKSGKKKGKDLFNIPKSSGLDWLSNWLNWTVIGFLFNNLKGFLDWIKPIWNNVIKPVGKFILDIGQRLIDAFTMFVDVGFSAYESVKGLIGDLGGEDAEKDFEEASKGLTTLMNAAIITLMIAASTKPGGSGGKPTKPNSNRPGRPGTPVNRGRNGGVTQGRGGRPRSGGIFRRGPKITQGGTGPRLLDRFTGKGAAGVTQGLGGRLTGRLGLRAAGRVLKPVLARLPIVGGLIEFFISWALGDPIGKAAFRGVGSVLLGALGGIIGSVIPGPGTFIGAALGGMAGGEIAGRLYDMIFGGKNPPKPPKPPKPQEDNTPVSKSQKKRKNRRSVQKVEKNVTVGNVDKTPTNPGSDLFSKARIEKFYGKTFTSGNNTPYDFLVNASNIAKNNRGLNGVIGSLMGSGIDLTLGQKPDERSIKQISDTLSSFAAASMQKDLNKAIIEIQEMFALEEGGSVPTSRAISRRKDNPLIKMKENLERNISNAINITSMEIIAKLSNTIKYGSGGGKKDKKDKKPKTDNTTPSGLTTSGGGSDFWTLVAVASLEDADPQARADVAQSIYNRQTSGAYGSGSIRDLILDKEQYKPVWTYPNGTKNGYGNPNDEWLQIVDAETAAIATGKSVEFIQKAASNITNPSLQKKAKAFVGGRTDFTNYSKSSRKGEVIRSTSKPNNYFGWDWNYQGTTVASTPDLGAMREETAIASRMGDGIGTGGEVKGDPVVTSQFGKLRGSRRHGGTDIAAPIGTPLTAVRNGVYLDEFFESAWGMTSVYKTDNGEYHLYAHQSKRAGKKKGDKIKAGEIIGYVGSSGRSTGPHLHWEVGTGWNGYVLSGKSDPLKKYSYKLPVTVGRKETQKSKSDDALKKVSPLVSAIPTATGLGKQGTTKTTDYGIGSGAGQKGYIIVPGHAAGGGAPGEMELTPELAKNIVANVKKRVGPNVPIKVLDMHGSTANTDSAFVVQQNKLKELERQGYEVIELHMDASIESGYGTGRGVILPMPGTDAINPVEADFARTSGAFGRTHRGGLAGTNRGISLIELGNMSPELQRKVLKGSGLNKQELDKLTKPLEDSLIRGMGLQERASLGVPQSREVASIQRTPDYAEGQTTIFYQKEVVLVG